jgi:hypothetical protein
MIDCILVLGMLLLSFPVACILAMLVMIVLDVFINKD